MSRKKTISFAALAFFGGLGCVPALAEGASVPKLKAEAADLTQEYAGQLQAALGGAMAADGPIDALAVGHDVAPAIAADLSHRRGWIVARTSLKQRNTRSAPGDYERKVMDEFNSRIAKGEKAADLVSAEIVEDHGGKVFRFIKAIPTSKKSLARHGAEVKAEVKAKIAELYPEDRAAGFMPATCGVFTLQKRRDTAGRLHGSILFCVF